MKVIVVGGGPAGMMAAITAAKEKNQVILLEKMNMLGKKLLITGKGRCNITSSLPIEEFIANIPGNGRFLYSAFKQYTNQDVIRFLEEEKVMLKEERGNRIFPVSDRSYDVLQAFLRRLKQEKVEIRTNTTVKEILVENQKVKGVVVQEGKCIMADKVILTTGGKSYPTTGSTGDGYRLAQALGHTITNLKPSLVPFCANKEIVIEIPEIKKTSYQHSLALCKSMQGLSLKNVAIKIEDIQNHKIIYEDFGEMLFTHFGVSGPTILSGSAHVLRYPKIEDLLKEGKVVLNIDLKPALSEQKLDSRLLRDFEKYKNKAMKNALEEVLPQKLIIPILKLAGIPEDKKVNEITKEERMQLGKVIKKCRIEISGFRPIEEAIITAGGVSIKEIDPKTMQSKLIEGLYFAGEVIDVDAYTGGFNLQIAYSTGYVAGKTNYEKEKST